jgi:hypothetical protein
MLRGDRRPADGYDRASLLIAQFRELAPWDVTWIDGAAAIARRACDLLGVSVAGTIEEVDASPNRHAIFTSGRVAGTALSRRLAEFGIDT